MPSLVAWLDASSEDQRRMREIVNLFSERDSRDELGIGQIRDALSDTLFPGTSTLLTRARYMLLIPWAFTTAAKPGLDAEQIARRVEVNERNLIGTLKRDSDGEGLLGKSAGTALKTLPSSIYWVALRQYGILRDRTLSQADAIAVGQHHDSFEEGDEALTVGAWSTTLPEAPTGYPETTAGGFDLRRSEAEWLRDRMLEGTEGSLLAHLVDHRPQSDSAAPWLDPATLGATAEITVQVRHARLFSLAMSGAALLYNLLLAEAYEAAGYDRVTGAADAYRQRISDWHKARSRFADDLASWQRDDFWDLIQSKNPRATRSRSFVNGWLDAATSDSPLDIADDEKLREFINSRERQHKGPQARLHNPRLLQSWLGGSGASPLTFRWTTVRGILTDLHDGLERDGLEKNDA